MEAKDTVMSPEQMVKMKHKWEIRDAQAEITFKRCQEEEREQQRIKTVGIMREVLQEERQQGRREVVEWVSKAGVSDIGSIQIYPNEWSNKLKEWGIKNGS